MTNTPNPLPYSPLTIHGLAELRHDARIDACATLLFAEDHAIFPESKSEAYADAVACARLARALLDAAIDRSRAESEVRA